MKVYMLVTDDEYELPLIVRDSITELARANGVTPGAIWSCIWKSKIFGTKSVYVEVEIDDE